MRNTLRVAVDSLVAFFLRAARSYPPPYLAESFSWNSLLVFASLLSLIYTRRLQRRGWCAMGDIRAEFPLLLNCQLLVAGDLVPVWTPEQKGGEALVVSLSNGSPWFSAAAASTAVGLASSHSPSSHLQLTCCYALRTQSHAHVNIQLHSVWSRAKYFTW